MVYSKPTRLRVESVASMLPGRVLYATPYTAECARTQSIGWSKKIKK